MKLTKFDTLESLIEFLKTNPSWISGFVDGGLQPQAEFNIVQNNVDTITSTIKELFGNKGGVYSRPNSMSVYTVRNTKDLREVIIS